MQPQPPSTMPLQNSNRTTPGWFSQQTRGWPWSSWTNRTTSAKPKLYYRTPTPTKYSPRTPPPTSKNKLITLLKDIKQTGGLSTQKYKELYPTSAVPPKIYGLPKIHKAGTPSDLLFPVGGQSHMGLPRSSPTSSNPL